MILNQNEFTEYLEKVTKTHASGNFHINYYQPIEESTWKLLSEKFFFSTNNYFYCCIPNLKFSILAFDELLSIYEQNFKEFNSIVTTFNRLKRKIVSNAGKFNLIQTPLLFGMVKFPSEIKEKTWTDFSDLKWFIPKFTLLNQGPDHFLVINAVYYPGLENYIYSAVDQLLELNSVSCSEKEITYKSSEPDLGDWGLKINYALKNISDGTIQKMVLARYEDLELSERPDVKSLMNKLENQFPGCYTFAYKSGKSVFFGSSPEKLFSVSDNMLMTDALAGSIKRGETDEDDLQLQNQLLLDKKNLAEHQAVINFLKEQLSPISEELHIEHQPVIRKLSNIQHLYTPITAKIKEDVSVFTILDRIHPTPAVCGIPPQISKNLIGQIENFERGLYAGALGWIGLNNSAEMFVGIRSAVLKEKNLRAFAGGGIVEGSNNLDEYNETVLKLKPILSLFHNENFGKS